jgi:hypothetical protein
VRHVVLVIEIETLGIFDEAGAKPRPVAISAASQPPPVA